MLAFIINKCVDPECVDNTNDFSMQFYSCVQQGTEKDHR